MAGLAAQRNAGADLWQALDELERQCIPTIDQSSDEAAALRAIAGIRGHDRFRGAPREHADVCPEVLVPADALPLEEMGGDQRVERVVAGIRRIIIHTVALTLRCHGALSMAASLAFRSLIIDRNRRDGSETNAARETGSTVMTIQELIEVLETMEPGREAFVVLFKVDGTAEQFDIAAVVDYNGNAQIEISEV